MNGKMIGKYELLEKRGEGGFGILYKAFDTVMEREVALKLLHQHIAEDERLSAWFHREAKAMAKLNHPNIVIIYDFERVDNNHFIVMEYIDGRNVDEIMREKGAFNIDESISIARQLLSALEDAHSRGIIHRDIKPSNIMLTASGQVKITDFGIAKILGSSKLTQTGTAAGSLPYMSPEQIRGKAIDPRTDIYSLGITLYQMLTGDVPFKEDSDFALMQAHIERPPPKPSIKRADIPAGLEDILLKSLEKKVEDRFGTASEMSQALLQFQKQIAAGEDKDRTVLEGAIYETGSQQDQAYSEDLDRTIVKKDQPLGRHIPQKKKAAERAGDKKWPRPVLAILGAVVIVVAIYVIVHLIPSKENGLEPIQDEKPNVAADFSFEPQRGEAPLSLQFKDLSRNGPTSWNWDFGDGARSTEQNPQHIYADSGTFHPRLIASNRAGADTITSSRPVTVLLPPVPQSYSGKLEIYYSPFDFTNRADIYLDGKSISHDDVPVRFDTLKPGRHTILLVKQSPNLEHASFFDTVTVTENPQTRRYNFFGPSGKVRISAGFIGGSANLWGEIYIDDKKQEDVGTPFALDLPEGPHKISVVKEGYETVNGYKIVTVVGDGDMEVNFKLRKK